VADEPLLSFERVSKRYWRGRHEIVALDDVSFEVDAGELAAVFGRRAAGKSTLLRLAAGLDAPDSGTVRLQGEDLFPQGRSPRLGGLPTGIGWMQRSAPLMPAMHMLDYVAMPLLESTPHRLAQQRSARALDRMAVSNLADAIWSGMSDAERMLAMLARAIVREPTLLLADDPTAGLDTREREIVLGLLRRASESGGMAVLVTVPEVPDMLRSHRVMALSDGELMQPTRHKRGEVIDFPHRRNETA
jgi:ABC-type multidrug transport system ATPase subunit